jgi:ankyrin repeat protein
MFAAYYGRADVIKLLVKKGADYTVKSKNGLGVMHFAA